MLLTGLAIAILACGFMAVRAGRLLASALWLAACSAFLAVLLYRLGAFEVAVIELSVGAGLVTVLFVFSINVAGEESIGSPSVLPRGLAWLLCLAPLAVIGVLVVPALRPAALPAAAVFANVLWRDRALDVIVQVVLIYAGVLGLLGLLAEKEAPLQHSAAREAAAHRERDLQTMETAARHEEVQA
ncbi:MAG TPA: hydrogenase subunit MbhD domain-containing protein [Anaerolineales bacterium]|nr:hydrogenase subunit MbhD domain-containing protein [Anaerolineales bacterium]